MMACHLDFATSVLQDMTLSGGCPTGLEPAPSGATRGRSTFLSVTVRCRIGLSMPITLLGSRVVSAWCEFNELNSGVIQCGYHC
jgi:hypothetical protein